MNQDAEDAILKCFSYYIKTIMMLNGLVKNQIGVINYLLKMVHDDFEARTPTPLPVESPFPEALAIKPDTNQILLLAKKLIKEYKPPRRGSSATPVREKRVKARTTGSLSPRFGRGGLRKKNMRRWKLKSRRKCNVKI
jgi:hypothetical protein